MNKNKVKNDAPGELVEAINELKFVLLSKIFIFLKFIIKFNYFV